VVKEALESFGGNVVEGSSLRRIRRFLVGQATVEELDGKVLEFNDSVSDFSIVPGEVYLLDLTISTGAGKVYYHPQNLSSYQILIIVGQGTSRFTVNYIHPLNSRFKTVLKFQTLCNKNFIHTINFYSLPLFRLSLHITSTYRSIESQTRRR